VINLPLGGIQQHEVQEESRVEMLLRESGGLGFESCR
jgi:hypothetical protein